MAKQANEFYAASELIATELSDDMNNVVLDVDDMQLFADVYHKDDGNNDILVVSAEGVGDPVKFNFFGNLEGDVHGDLTGDVIGNVTGNVTGDLTGDVVGNVTGNVVGDINSNGQSVFSNIVNFQGAEVDFDADTAVDFTGATVTGLPIGDRIQNQSEETDEPEDIKFWTGTLAEYNAIDPKEDDVLYLVK